MPPIGDTWNDNVGNFGHFSSSFFDLNGFRISLAIFSLDIIDGRYLITFSQEVVTDGITHMTHTHDAHSEAFVS